MPFYRICTREVHVQPVLVEADSPEDAIQRVRDGEGDTLYDELEYSHTLDWDTWGEAQETDERPLESEK